MEDPYEYERNLRKVFLALLGVVVVPLFCYVAFLLSTLGSGMVSGIGDAQQQVNAIAPRTE